MAAEQDDAAGQFQRLFGLAQGYIGSAAIKAGIDLHIFTHIAKGADTSGQLAALEKITPRAARILCDALVGLGVLGKSGGRYTLPPASAMMLVEGSPMYMGGMARISLSPLMWEQAGKLTEIVRAGHSILTEGAEAPDNPFWHEFNLGSRQQAAMNGPAYADLAATLFPQGGPTRILDIACGSGLYGFSALKRFPGAKLTSVDWPGVLELTRPLAAEMGLADRVEFRPGDIFNDDLGAGYDLILAVNIYHHFSLEKNLELSRRLHAAAAPGARLMIVDMVPDEERATNRFALTFALTMLIWTREGDTYTLSEYRRIVEPAGFRDVALRDAAGPRPLQAIVARK